MLISTCKLCCEFSFALWFSTSNDIDQLGYLSQKYILCNWFTFGHIELDDPERERECRENSTTGLLRLLTLPILMIELNIVLSVTVRKSRARFKTTDFSWGRYFSREITPVRWNVYPIPCQWLQMSNRGHCVRLNTKQVYVSSLGTHGIPGHFSWIWDSVALCRFLLFVSICFFSNLFIVRVVLYTFGLLYGTLLESEYH